MTLKFFLQAAQKAFASHDFEGALSHCESALQHDGSSYNALVLLGKVQYKLGHHEASQDAYQHATEAAPQQLPAWKGLAELHTATGNAERALQAYERLAALSEGTEPAEKQQEYKARMLELYLELGLASQAVSLLEQQLHNAQEGATRLELLCRLVSLQIHAGQNCGSLQQRLEEVVHSSEPSGKYVHFHEALLHSQAAAMLQQPQGSPERQRITAIVRQACRRILSGACCSALPLDLSLKLMDAEDAIDEGVLDFTSQRGGDTFPGPSRQALLGLQLNRQLVQASSDASKRAARVTVVEALEPLTAEAEVSSLHAVLLLGHLHLQNGDASAALAASTHGLKALRQRRQQGWEVSEAVAAQMVLLYGQSLLAAGRLADASKALNAVAGAQDTPYSQLLGHVLPDTHRLASRSLAALTKAQGNAAAAQEQLQELCRTLQEGHEPEPYWLAGDLSSLALEQGDAEAARQLAESALKAAEQAGSAAADTELASLCFILGCACWELGGQLRSDKRHAHAHWLTAAGVQGAHQAGSFTRLGQWFKEVAQDTARARKCFQRALSLDANEAAAGEALCAMLAASGSSRVAHALCLELTARAPHATWAWRRLGFQHLQLGEAEKAIAVFQTALRGDVGHAAAWEGLGLSYQTLGRLTASLKAYGRAIDLDPARLFSLVQSGTILLSLGNASAGLKRHRQALAAAPAHVPALCGTAETLLALAKMHSTQGATGQAALELHQAVAYATTCTREQAQLQSGWKLLGDVHLQHHAVTPMGEVEAIELQQRLPVSKLLQRWQRRITAMSTARRAFLKALHLGPASAAAWGDVAATFYHEAQLRRSHPSFQPQKGDQLRSTAQRLLTGALRLEPASSTLWAALGTCAREPALCEYALARSLQLEPKASATWAALGRLYLVSGEPGLADRCLTQARSHEPASVATWEAMGALAGLSPSGSDDKFDCFQHATKLSAGPEALLGYAEGMLRRGFPGSGSVYAAAQRTVEAQPCNAAAHAALGLACEARGAWSDAAHALGTAVELAQESLTNGALKARASSQTVSSVSAEGPLPVLLQQNLARVLVRAGRLQEALGVYERLQAEGILKQPAARMAFAEALASTGSSSCALEVLQGALEGDPTGEEHAAVLHAIMRLHLATDPNAQAAAKPDGLHQALSALHKQMPALLAAKPPATAVEPLMQSILAAALVHKGRQGWDSAAGGQVPKEVQAARRLLQRWLVEADADTAEVQGRLLAVEGQVELSLGRRYKALRVAAQAVHTCPWAASLWGTAAARAMDHSPRHAPAAARICRQPALSGLHRAARSYSSHLHADRLPPETIRQAQHVRAAGFVAQAYPQAARTAAADFKAAVQWAHAEPWSPAASLMAALVAVHRAGVLGTAAAYRAAAELCRRAVSLHRAAARHHSPAGGGLASGQPGTFRASSLAAVSDAEQLPGLQVKHPLVQLQCGLSECLLHSHLEGCTAQALKAAEAAVQLAGSERQPAAWAHHQIGRCHAHAGRVEQAAAAHQQALAADLSWVPAAIALAQALSSLNQPEQAVGVLQQAQQQLSGRQLEAGALQFVDIQGAEQLLLLEQARTLQGTGHAGGARTAAEAAASLAQQSGGAMQGHIVAAQVVLGLVLLQASQEPAEGRTKLLGKAWRSLSAACLLQSQAANSGGAQALAAALLAQAEAAGNLRRKEERVAHHISQAFEWWAGPLPAALYLLAAAHQIAAERASQPLARAVHTAPQLKETWHYLAAQ